MNNKVYLIEDWEKQANEIMQKLNAIALEKNTEDFQIAFDFLPGTVNGVMNKNEYLFYEESVLTQIENLYENAPENERMCILLDVMLVREDYDSGSTSGYSKADLAKKIYLKFRRKMPIYIMTSAPWFGTQSDVVMGVDLSEQFITKNAILVYEIEEDIDKLFDFYRSEKIENA